MDIILSWTPNIYISICSEKLNKLRFYLKLLKKKKKKKKKKKELYLEIKDYKKIF